MQLPWQKKEKKDAKRFGARRTLRSGGIWFDPGDSKSSDFLFESKHTDKKSFSVTRKMWDKIQGEAIDSEKTPAILVEFADGMELVVLNNIDFQSWFKEDKT